MNDRITITVSEMAARTGLSRTFLFSEIKDGRLRSLKIGKHRLIRTEDVAAYLDYYDNHRTAA
jgi:excisionase family DNA binding protein